MFRNQYDNDVTTWSPQGRLHQVEYAMEAVKQGSACVGLKNQDYAILLALKRSTSELSAHQKKIIPVDEHIGIAIAGLTADARILSRYMKNECTNERYAYDQLLPVSRLVSRLGLKMQACTQRYDRRPFGVGLLIAGYDSKGPHIYQTCPSANCFDCKCMAIGARSQSGRTYLEKNMDTFTQSNLSELIKHGLLALRECLAPDSELSTKNVSIAIVGKDKPFSCFDDEHVNEWLSLIPEDERKSRKGRDSQMDQDAGPSGGPPQPPPDPSSGGPQVAVATVEHMSVD